MERQRKEKTDEKDLNQLKWSKSIRLVAAHSRAELSAFILSRVCLTTTFYSDPVTQAEGRFNA